MLRRAASNPLSLEYQPSPLAALGSVCGPPPSGTAHPLHKEKEGDREKRREELHSTAQAFLGQKNREEKRWESGKRKGRNPQESNRERPQRAKLMHTHKNTGQVTTKNMMKVCFWYKMTENREHETITSNDKCETWGRQNASN